MIKADFHIHTVLSPCGDIEMTPVNIVNAAKERGLSVIGICDHNSTLNARVVREVGAECGVYVMTGAEITTSEEIHVLIFVDGDEALDKLQKYIEKHINRVPNNPDLFGYQPVIDRCENILDQVDYLLINSTDLSIDDLEDYASSSGAIIIPAHINKPSNSLISQLGFIPAGSRFNAVEIFPESPLSPADREACSCYRMLTSSDAHYTHHIGKFYTELDVNLPISFNNILDALK